MNDSEFIAFIVLFIILTLLFTLKYKEKNMDKQNKYNLVIPELQGIGIQLHEKLAMFQKDLCLWSDCKETLCEGCIYDVRNIETFKEYLKDIES